MAKPARGRRPILEWRLLSWFLVLLCSSALVTGSSQVCNEATASLREREHPRSCLSDLELWIPGDNLSQKVVNAWCNETVRDAIRANTEAQSDAAVCKQEKSACQRTLAEREREWNMAEANTRLQFFEEKVQSEGVWKEEKLLVQVRLSAERDAIAADLAFCKAKNLGVISLAECNYEKQLAVSECENERQVFAARLSDNTRSSSSELLSSHGMDLVSCQEGLTEQQNRIGWLQESLGYCRYEKAQAEATIQAQPGLQDVRIEELDRLIKVLSGLLVAFVTLCLGLAAALAITLLSSVRNEGRQKDSDSLIKSMATNAIRSHPHMLSSEEARCMLAKFFEDNESHVTTILTYPDVSQKQYEIECTFLLVPVNMSSCRRFALFGGGGDYTRQVEVAQEFVSNQWENKRLVVLLYEFGGRAFTERTLDGLEISAERLAFEAVPKDQDFPSDDDLVVLWVSEKHGLQVSDSGGESVFSGIIKQQTWAQYLAKTRRL